ncbi:MAG: hypothetical protein JXD21_00575 [Candidatus Omnitrophica bacterium]|nr:hypothetical protein [Candidatus Omnitrophota bacterium]
MIFAWCIREPLRAALLDQYILYNVDDIFRYCYIKAAPYNWLIFLNPYVKVGYAIMGSVFHILLPFGIFSLRIMNILFSCATLFLVYRIARMLSLSRRAASIAVFLAITFPVYFLGSISTFSEIMFAFMILLAVFLTLKRKYTVSFMLVAFLPLFRQVEGLLCIAIWLGLFRGKYKKRYAIFMGIPFILWSIFIIHFLKYDFFQIFFYLYPSVFPVSATGPFDRFLILGGILFLHPVILMAFWGAKMNWRDPRYWFVTRFFLIMVAFLAGFQITHFFHSLRILSQGLFCLEGRILIPLVPLMAILSSAVLERYLFPRFMMKKIYFVGGIALLVLVCVFQIRALQYDVKRKGDSLSRSQEYQIKESSRWLSVYMRQQNISAVCVPGSLTTHKVIRRIWMYLPGSTSLYGVGGEHRVVQYIGNGIYDMQTMTVLTGFPRHEQAVLLSLERIDPEAMSGNIKVEYIRYDQRIPLYFYLMNVSDPRMPIR